MYTKIVNVTTSGTPVQLPNVAVPNGVGTIIKARATNTGKICIAGNSTDAVNTTSNHFRLSADVGVIIAIKNLNELYIDATVNGEGVEILFEGSNW